MALLIVSGCGDGTTSMTSGVPIAAFMARDCARSLDVVGARLRIAGHALACPMTIDREAGLVVGECAGVSAGAERRVALEYFVLFDGELVVLAQQVGRVDLVGVEEDQVQVVIPAAIASRRCLGNLATAEVNESVCDNDGDGMENLAEYCHESREPLIAEQAGEP